MARDGKYERTMQHLSSFYFANAYIEACGSSNVLADLPSKSVKIAKKKRRWQGNLHTSQPTH